MLLVFRHCWCTLPGAAIALLAMSLSATPARAECGDYVRIGAEAMHHPMPSSRSGPVAPSHDPSCQSRQDAPLIPPAPAPVPITDLLCSFTSSSVPSPSRGGWIDLDDLNYSAKFQSDIFHPPKRIPG